MDLTILLPTKNIYKFLVNLLDYYEENKFSGKIIVIDGSNKIIRNKIKKYIEGRKKIQYLHFNDPITIAIKKSEKYISTNYVLHSGDDDYYVVSSLNILLNKLKKNENIAGIAGRTLLCEISPNNKIESISHYNALKSRKEKTPYNRLIANHNNYSNLLWFIIRKKVFFKAYRNASKKLMFKVFYDELIINYTLSIYSKFLFKEYPYLLRVVGHRSSGQTLKKKISKVNFLLAEKKFKKKLYNELIKYGSKIKFSHLSKKLDMKFVLKKEKSLNKSNFFFKKNLKYIYSKYYKDFYIKKIIRKREFRPYSEIFNSIENLISK